MKEYKYKINGNLYKVQVGDIEDNIAHVEVNGTAYTVELQREAKPKIKPVIRPTATTPAAPPPAISRPSVPSGGKVGIKSPLPGVILMENDIKADHDGKVISINVSKGESILEGTDLIIIE